MLATNQSKQNKKNKLINQLLNNGVYETIYNKYCDYLEETESDNIDILLDKYINNKQYQILEMFNFCIPDELEQYKEGLIYK